MCEQQKIKCPQKKLVAIFLEKTMIISDLSYLEAVEANNVFGGDFNYFVNKDVNIDIDVDEFFDIDKFVDVDVDLSDNLATAESSANAFGNNTLAEAFGFTYTSNNESHANAFAVSGTD
jgi:hypothetical protein